MSQEIRSFLAFELPAHMKETVSKVSEDLRTLPMNIRWVKPGNIHLTVIFMGNIPMDILPQLGEEVQRVCSLYGPFGITIDGVGIFGSKKSPRVLWVGVEGDIERMSFFKKALEKRLRGLGIKGENRKFNPHLTLGRFKKGPSSFEALDHIQRKYGGLTSKPGQLNELILYKSELKPGGAVYTKISSWPLTGKK